jgi:hypothetical protein
MWQQLGTECCRRACIHPFNKGLECIWFPWNVYSSPARRRSDLPLFEYEGLGRRLTLSALRFSLASFVIAPTPFSVSFTTSFELNRIAFSSFRFSLASLDSAAKPQGSALGETAESSTQQGEERGCQLFVAGQSQHYRSLGRA